MEAMDTVKPEIARLFTVKEARRRRLAALPFSEKVRAVVRLQEMVAPVLAAVSLLICLFYLGMDDKSNMPSISDIDITNGRV